MHEAIQFLAYTEEGMGFCVFTTVIILSLTAVVIGAVVSSR